MRIEITFLLGRYTWNYGVTLGLEWRGDWSRACDFPSAWITVGLASRRNAWPLLPKQRHFHFTALLEQRK